MTELTRRGFLGSVAGAAAAATTSVAQAQEAGAQRLSLEALKAWEALAYGMFIHFGMSTYDGDELSKGDKPSTFYNPTKLDVDQWVSVARDAGMRYAVLTAKHVSGHCLWPSRLTDYHVGTSSNKTNVVEAFLKACERRGVMGGLYYCSWDNHHRFGSITPTDLRGLRAAGAGAFNGATVTQAFVTREYEEFQWRQLEELLTQYGPVGEVWIDIPRVLSRDYRQRLYWQIAKWQPKTVIMMNHGIGDGSTFDTPGVWPSDLVAIERFLPNSAKGHQGWRTIEGKRYYLPGEVCDPIAREWFWVEGDPLRSDRELLGMYLLSRERNASLLLDVPPDKAGRIPDASRDALLRLQKAIARS